MALKISKSTLLIITIVVLVNILIVIWQLPIDLFRDAGEFLIWFMTGSKNLNFFIFSDDWQFYRPVTLQLMYFMYLVWGWNPVPYHLVTIVFGIFNGLLVYAVGLKALKNEYLAGLAVLLFLLASGIYYQVYYWVACFFYLFYAFFGLLGIYCFLKYYFADEKKWYWFILSIVFLSLSVLSNEAGIFTIVALPLFELLDVKFMDFLKRNVWKYMGFIPIALIFLGSHLFTSQAYQHDWYHLPVVIPIAIAWAAGFLLIYYAIKTEKWFTKPPSINLFLISLAYFATFTIILKGNPRSPYMPTMTYALVAVALLVAPNYSSLVTFFRKAVFTKHYPKKKFYKLIGMSVLITLSTSSLVINGIYWFQMGYQSSAVANQVIQQTENPTNTSIYVLNVPLISNFYMAAGEAEVNRLIHMKTGIYYSVNVIYLEKDVQILVPNQIHLLFINGFTLLCDPGRGEIIAENYFNNNITNNASCVVYLYDPFTFQLTNVSGLLYAEL
ncbi:MAG: ArnT family glycosyltransferase [Candidatus Helarchaeota archaeon]